MIMTTIDVIKELHKALKDLSKEIEDYFYEGASNICYYEMQDYIFEGKKDFKKMIDEQSTLIFNVDHDLIFVDKNKKCELCP